MNILIVDDHKILAEGLAELIKKAKKYTIEGVLTKGLDVLPFLETHQTDMIILDLEMPDISGIVLAKEILKKYTSMKILILTMHTEPEYFEQLFNAGIMGYMNKNADKNEIWDALESIQAGNTYYSQNVITEYINYQKKPKSDKNEELRITQREKDVLKLILEGNTTLEICVKLCVTKNTVDSHRKNLLSKLGVKNTAELVKLAIEKKLV
jgi:two-component system, NarL family, nitrate/nitrite response regulator NarL